MDGKVLMFIFAVYVLAIGSVIYILFFKKNDIKKRLKSIEELGGKDGQMAVDATSRKKIIKPKINVSDKVKKELEASGLKIEPEEFIILWALIALLPPFLAYLLSNNLIIFLIALGLGAAAPPMFIKYKEKKRKEKFGEQLGDALLLVGNCLRSGFSFRKALDRIVKDMENPISEEFERALAQVSYGATIGESLEAMAKRMDNHELELLNSAVTIHQKAGGKLSDIIESVARTIRERIQLHQTVKTLTAQGRISGLVVSLLPVIMLIFLGMLNPSYMSILFNTFLGNVVLVVAGIMEILGMLLIRQIVNIEIQ